MEGSAAPDRSKECRCAAVPINAQRTAELTLEGETAHDVAAR